MRDKALHQSCALSHFFHFTFSIFHFAFSLLLFALRMTGQAVEEKTACLIQNCYQFHDSTLTIDH